MPRKTADELLDELLAEQANGTYVDPVASAKQFLGRDQFGDVGPTRAAAAARQRPVLEQNERDATARFNAAMEGRGKRALLAGAAPLALLGGPIGLAAGGVLSVSALNDAIDDPSAGNIAMAALGALPFVRPVKNAVRTMREVQAVKAARARGTGSFSPWRNPNGPSAFSREVPYRAGGGTSGQPISRVQGPAPTRSGHVVGHDLNYGGPQAPAPRFEGGITRGAGQQPETLMQRARGQVDDVLAGLGETPQGSTRPMPGRPSPPPSNPLAVTNEFTPWKGAKDIRNAVTRLLGMSDDAAEAAPVIPPNGTGGRPPADFVHGADTSGGMFGFEEVPEISEGELSRLQQLFKREAGR